MTGSSDEETDQDGRSSPMGPIASDTAEGNAGVSSARRLSASSPSLRKSLSVASFASPSEKVTHHNKSFSHALNCIAFVGVIPVGRMRGLGRLWTELCLMWG